MSTNIVSIKKKSMVIWFSCGAASAVVAKICLAKYSETHEITIARIVISNEHPDNDRFARDCEKWFGIRITNVWNDKYADCWEVWEKEKYIVSPFGAPCTTQMKKKVRLDFENAWYPDVQVFGYTKEEEKRAERFRLRNPDVNLLTPLIDENISKSDCLAMIKRAGIDPPMMYQLGFNNNNCIGCPKGGMGYWNRIRIHFPEVFKRMARLERSLDYAILKQKGKPVFLDELSPKAGRHKETVIDCSLDCFRGEQYYALMDKEREEKEREKQKKHKKWKERKKRKKRKKWKERKKRKE